MSKLDDDVQAVREGLDGVKNDVGTLSEDTEKIGADVQTVLSLIRGGDTSGAEGLLEAMAETLRGTHETAQAVHGKLGEIDTALQGAIPAPTPDPAPEPQP